MSGSSAFKVIILKPTWIGPKPGDPWPSFREVYIADLNRLSLNNRAINASDKTYSAPVETPMSYETPQSRHTNVSRQQSQARQSPAWHTGHHFRGAQVQPVMVNTDGASTIQAPARLITPTLIGWVIEADPIDKDRSEPDYTGQNHRPLRPFIDTGSHRFWFWNTLRPDLLEPDGGKDEDGNPTYKMTPEELHDVPTKFRACLTSVDLARKIAEKKGPSLTNDSEWSMIAYYADDNAIGGHYYKLSLWFFGRNETTYKVYNVMAGLARLGTAKMIQTPMEGVLGLVPTRGGGQYKSFLESALHATAIEKIQFWFEFYRDSPTADSKLIIGELPKDKRPVIWFPCTLLDRDGSIRRWAIEIDSYTVNGTTYHLEGLARHFIIDTGSYGCYGDVSMTQNIYSHLGGSKGDGGIWQFPFNQNQTTVLFNAPPRKDEEKKKDKEGPSMGFLNVHSLAYEGVRDMPDTARGTMVPGVFQDKGSQDPRIQVLEEDFPYSVLGLSLLEFYAVLFDGEDKRIGFAYKGDMLTN